MQLFLSSAYLEKYSRIWNENGNDVILQKERKWDWKQEACSGLSCGLYGSVDFGEDYREVTGRFSRSGEIVCVRLFLLEYGVF